MNFNGTTNITQWMTGVSQMQASANFIRNLMRYIKLILVTSYLAAVSGLTLGAQEKKLLNSDSLVITVNKDFLRAKTKITKLTFCSLFEDSVQLFVNKKQVFARNLKTSFSTGIVSSIDYIHIPTQRSSNLTIKFYNEKLTRTVKIIPGYEYIYIYKDGSQLIFD